MANCAGGRRLVELTSPAWWRAMAALLLLGPWTPMLFQGQEWASRAPFVYFSNHDAQLQAAVVTGRQQFLAQFSRHATTDQQATPAGTSPAECQACNLEHDLSAEQQRAWNMHRDLLALRRRDFGDAVVPPAGATLSDQVLALRHAGHVATNDRLLVVNLGPDLNLAGIAEPLLAAPEGCQWAVLWSSEARQYGGSGIAACTPPDRIIATGHAATVFHPIDLTP